VKVCPGNYTIKDSEQDGVIKVLNAHDVVLDGDSVIISGPDFRGYAIVIKNSSRIQIKNFAGVKKYFYAIRIENSDSVTITNCNLSDNKKDTAGFIDVWSDVNNAHGGGVLMYQCRACVFTNNVMKNSNDGIAMYHSTSSYIANNDLSYNMAYAIRMFFADSNVVQNNNCSHIYRENPVNSDAGAILMIVSNNNRVEHNDFSYSSDGIFLGQYGHSRIPNKNYFAYNDCSYSPHNAIEATFADGNVFKHNKANYSGYGFWLGYSFNTIVDSNEIIGNHEALSVGTAGIAIERGFNNRFTNNIITGNVRGIWLWEAGVIAGYEGQHSHDYVIENNVLTGNLTAVDVNSTEYCTLRSNQITDNGKGITISGIAKGTVLTDNTFDRTLSYYIENNSTYGIDARNNSFSTDDSSYIRCKIFDHEDDPTKGTVMWSPFISGAPHQIESTLPLEFTEAGSSTWTTLASDGRSTTVSWDSTFKKVGAASLKVVTQSGFDVNIHRWPIGNKIARWNLSGKSSIGVWFYAQNPSPSRFQYNSIRIGNDCGGYFAYTAPSSVLSDAVGQWKYYEFPLKGNSTWQRSIVGSVFFDNLSYIEVHADTWDAGFTLWIDGLSFLPLTSVEDQSANVPKGYALYQNYPNPFNSSTSIRYDLPVRSHVMLTIYDILGREVLQLVNEVKPAGSYQETFDASTVDRLSSGVYFYRIIAGGFTKVQPMTYIK